ncbi:MAG TPA: hypothetical protein VLF91_02430 [Candidatus Saccharimonadales bacterium]|nr:hypothetical protein [Candidatus Saccharimonadales bacterium]
MHAPHDLVMIVALVVPALLFLVLRVNASLVFLSLCLGTVLVQYVASQANDLITMLVPHASPISTSSLQLVLLLIPAIVTAIVTIFSMHGRLKTVINVLPAAGAAALAVLFAVPLLTPGLRANLESLKTWHYLSNSEALVIGAGAAVSLTFLWTQRSALRHHDKRHHR